MKSNVGKIRKEQNITQEQLAEDVGITRRALSSIENNQASPSVDVALRLSRRLNTYVEKLFELTDDPAGSSPPSPKARRMKAYAERMKAPEKCDSQKVPDDGSTAAPSER